MFHQLNRLCAGIVALGLLLGLASLVYAEAAPTASNDQLALRLNEFMANNTSIAADPSQPALFPDWIELYNPGPDPVNLDGLFLSNNVNKPTQLPLPTGLTIAPNGFIVLYADFRPSLGKQHINFSMNKNGGFLGLYANKGGIVIDTIKYKVQYPDVAQGRSPDGSGEWRYLTQPTPNSANAVVTPFIRAIERTPVIPTSDVSVTVTALITDNGTTTATLFYNLPNTDTQSIPMVVAANLISGTSFTAQIPAQPDGTLVYYYITTQDNDTLTDMAPHGAPEHSYAYKVGYQASTLYINELMADNASIKFPGDTTTPDWIEIYNPNPDAVDLSDFYLTTDSANPRLFDIPNGQTIPGGGFLVFLADRTPTKGPLHTNFTLKEGSGSFLGLYDELSGRFIDSLQFPAMSANVTYERAADGSANWLLNTCSSPNQSNAVCGSENLTPGAYLPYVQK